MNIILIINLYKNNICFSFIRTDLDGQCKKWRLFADILNDLAMGLELLLPYFSSYSLGILCISTAMKSIVGVAGGATRAALTQHQVKINLKTNLFNYNNELYYRHCKIIWQMYQLKMEVKKHV